MTKNLLLSSLILTLGACASKEMPKETAGAPATSIEAKQLAAENQSSYVTEVGFARGGRGLSTEAKGKIDNIVKEAGANGKIDDVKVIVWADQEYPSVNAGELSHAQRKLADQRGEAIKKYLNQDRRGVDVDVYSMAERPGAISRLLDTTDARFKRSLEIAGIPNTDTSVKAPSKVGKAIVMVLLEDK